MVQITCYVLKQLQSVNMCIMSYVSKNECSVPDISIIHFCRLNLKVSHNFTSLVLKLLTVGAQLMSFWHEIYTEVFILYVKNRKLSHVIRHIMVDVRNGVLNCFTSKILVSSSVSL